MAKQMMLSTFVLVAGLYLILEGMASFLFLEDNPVFQMGRLARVAIGFLFLVFILPKVMK